MTDSETTLRFQAHTSPSFCENCGKPMSEHGPMAECYTAPAFVDCDVCGSLRNHHPVVHIAHGYHEACVDEGIADLVLACWERGIATDESCQGDGGAEPAFLSFDRVEDFTRFASLMVESGPRDSVFIGAVEAWEWNIFPLDAMWMEREMPSPDIPPVAGFLACVNLPLSDVPGAAARLRNRAG